MINNRVYGLLPKFTNYDQNGFIRGQNIVTIYDYYLILLTTQVSGAVLSIDLRKAFNSLKWSFIFEMLKLHGFQSKIKNLIKILYKKSKCRVVNNNYLSRFLTLRKK